MGRAHANALATLPMAFPDAPDVCRRVLVGRDETALDAAADRLGFAETTTDVEAAIDRADVFYNLGPNHVHVDPSLRALSAGLPVLCEKPLAPTPDGTRRLADAAAEAPVPTACAFNYRFVPAIRYARRLIEAGELGTIRHVRGRYLQDWLLDPDVPWSWRCDRERAGSGALGDLGSHTVDLVRYLVGDRPGGGAFETVSGRCHRFVDERPAPDGDGTRRVTVDDAYTATATLTGGAAVTLEASRAARGHDNDHRIEIEGTDGSLRFGLERLNELEVSTGDARGFETVLVTDADDPYGDRWWPPGHTLGWEHTFVHENYEFLSAVAAGEEFTPSFADGLAAQRVLDAIARSDERGERVAVTDVDDRAVDRG
ncbi:oxidoreductase [Halobacteriales archaeon SW_7_68_16]|nr:MAG: oxidoreductase [Halobacteriales archaeon SW_7_68_16]